MPQAVTVTPEERQAIERVSLPALVSYLAFQFNFQLSLHLKSGISKGT
jgi:hypothetical protein